MFRLSTVVLLSFVFLLVATAQVSERRGQGGNFSALGFGRLGFFLAGAGYHSERAWLSSSDFSVDIPVTAGISYDTDSAWNWMSPPSGAALSWGWFATTSVQATVTAPHCVAVTFYVEDPSDRRRQRLAFEGGTHDIVNAANGVYVTVVQHSEAVTYSLTTLSSTLNVVFNGILIDYSDACNVTVAPSPRQTPSPPAAATAQWTVGEATVVSGAGGNFWDLGYGRSGYLLGAAYYSTSRVQVPQPSRITVGFGVSSAWVALNADSRTLLPPNGARSSMSVYASQQLRFTVEVPPTVACTRVTFYLLDYDSTARRMSIARDGVVLAVTPSSFNDGAYYSFYQSASSATYVLSRTAGANVVASGVMLDTLASCARPASSPPVTDAPQSTRSATPTSAPASTRAAEDRDGLSTGELIVIVCVAAVVIVIGMVIAALVAIWAIRRQEDERAVVVPAEAAPASNGNVAKFYGAQTVTVVVGEVVTSDR